MRILLVNQHTVPVFADIALAFADAGHDVTLVAGHIEEGSRSIHGRVNVVNSIRYRRSSSLSRFSTWLAFTIHYGLYFLFSKRPDQVLVSTNPPLAPVVTRWVAKLRRIPFHVLIYDLYPEALTQAGFVSTGSMLFKRWQHSNRIVFGEASTIITLSNSMKSAVASYVPEDNVTVISNWTDTNYIRPIRKEDNVFVSRYGLTGKYVVLYSGNMGLTHDLESLIEAAALMRSDNRFIFVFIGDGGKKKTLVDLAERQKLENVLFLEHQQGENFPLAVAAADIGVVTLGTGAEGISVPSKTYVSLAAGQCLLAICPSESELARIVNDYQVGFTVEPGQPAEVARALRSLVDHPDQLASKQANARETSGRFSSTEARKYVTLIEGAVVDTSVYDKPKNK
jgi:glycosyltransferase involved in cell wall biosynthesis